jgi:lipopolysaccharide transport system permease protein
MPEPHESLHARYFGEHHVTVIEPARALGRFDWRELWAYRDLLFELSLRQVRVRYKQTLLGITWVLVQPLMQMLIFSTIFSRVARLPSEGLPYPVFVYAGLLAWSYFSGATTSAATSLAVNSHMITKVYFPRVIIPLAAVIASLLDFAVSAVVLSALLVIWHVVPGWSLLAAPCIVLCLMMTAAGVGSALGALSVAWRDLSLALPFLLQVWLYSTPVLYSKEAVPPGLRSLLALNPMTATIDLFRSAVVGRSLDLSVLLISIGLSAAVLLVGTTIFYAVERRFADVI